MPVLIKIGRFVRSSDVQNTLTDIRITFLSLKTTFLGLGGLATKTGF